MTDESFLSDSARLALFLILLTLAFAALIVAWVRGRQWGDLGSRRHYGEALSEEEKKTFRRSRRSFCIWAGISAALAALAFILLR